MKTHNEHAGSWASEMAAGAVSNVLDLIKRKLGPQVDEILAHDEAKKTAVSRQGSLAGRAEAARNVLQRLELQLATPMEADIPISLFVSFKNSTRIMHSLAVELAPYILLKEHGKQVIELARVELKTAEQALRDFEKANAGLLAEVESDRQEQAKADAQQMEAEQAAAFARRNATEQ